MTILYEPHQREAQRFAVVLGSDVHTATAGTDLLGLLAEHPTEDLVVLGPGVELGNALAIAAEYRLSNPNLGMVLVRDLVDVGLLGEALRSGIREVVAAEDPVALLAACARSREVSRHMAPATRLTARGSEAKVITVFSAKGGCGKTTLATNIAVALAARGNCRVGLIDLDLAFGDVAIMLQLAPERTIADAVGEHFDETLLRAILTVYGPGMQVLLAPPGPAEAERVTSAVVEEALAFASAIFDYVVIDTPPQFTDHGLTALDASHVHLLLTTPEIPALKNLRVTLDTLDLLGLPKENRLIVLNRSDAKVGLTSADIERVIRSPIAAHVPSSRDVPVSINRGVPIMVDNPQHPVSKAIRDFALGRLAGAARPKPAARSLRGMLGRGRS
jgi:pilus assembly protein CpaE